MSRVLPCCLVVTAALALTYAAAAQPASTPGTPPSLVGTWSGLSTSPNSHGQQAEEYGADGRFTAAGRRFDGLPYRVWGTWRSTPAGPDQLRVEVRIEGWFPREVCREGGVGPSGCQTARLPATDTSLVTFDGPDRMRSASEDRPGSVATETRDSDPALLRITVPERWTFSPVPSRSTPGCDELQQRRICAVNGGHLMRPSDGCLTCVAD